MLKEMRNMRLGVGVFGDGSLMKVIEYTLAAEKRGFESVWVADHYCFREIIVTMTALAMSTKKIKIGAGVANPYTRHAATYAMSLATLREIAGDRILFGIGAALRPQKQLLGKELKDNMARVKECIEVVQKLLAGETVNYKGHTICVNNLKLAFDGKGTIPIYVGAMGPRMIKLAGELSDGLLLSAGTSVNYAKVAISWLKEGTQLSGRDPQSIDVASYVMLSVSKDSRKAKNFSKSWIGTFITTPLFRPIAKLTGIDVEDVDRLKEIIESEGIKEGSRYVPDYVVDTITASGTPHECKSKLEEFAEAGISHVILVPMGPDPVKSVNVIAKQLGRVRKVLKG